MFNWSCRFYQNSKIESFYRIFTSHIRAVVVSVVDPAVQSGALAVVDVVGGAVIGIATPI
jgi:hypothetical protein